MEHPATQPTSDSRHDEHHWGTPRGLLRRVLTFALVLFGLFLVFRAVLELFVVDFDDPTDYAGDWGGPSLAGVLAVHMAPGIVSAVLLTVWVRRRWRRTMD